MDEHRPVLLEEALEALAIEPDGIYIDATFGRGGHAKEILKRLGKKGRLLALDKDPQAIRFARENAAFRDKRFLLKQGSFTMLFQWLKSLDLVGEINGILLDLGVSSPQLDDQARGFSFLREGPLDMRMDPEQGQSAAVWINRASTNEIADVLKHYGEERYARRIAAAIVRERAKARIETTKQLAEIVSAANPKWERHKHPATRTFQAIRIFINNELEELKGVLEQCLEVLRVHGRLAVICFHSLEDRIVKQFIAKQVKGGEFPRHLPILDDVLRPRLRRIGKIIRPQEKELRGNPRARSAVLRIAEKIA